MALGREGAGHKPSAMFSFSGKLGGPIAWAQGSLSATSCGAARTAKSLFMFFKKEYGVFLRKESPSMGLQGKIGENSIWEDGPRANWDDDGFGGKGIVIAATHHFKKCIVVDPAETLTKKAGRFPRRPKVGRRLASGPPGFIR